MNNNKSIIVLTIKAPKEVGEKYFHCLKDLGSEPAELSIQKPICQK